MKPEIERAIREVLEAWEQPDTRGEMKSAIYQMKRIYMAEVFAGLGRNKRRKPKKKSSMKPTHGGRRKNSGAKKKAVKAISRSVSMLPDEWDRLDRMRGDLSRGRFISSLLDGR